MSVDIAELGLKVRSDGVIVATDRLKKLGKAANDAETASMRLARTADKVGRSMQKMGRQTTLYVSAPIIAAAAASVKAFSDFDDAMIASMAIMGDLSDVVKKDMAAAARKMGKETAFSAKQAAESYFFLASAGLDAAASIAALPKVAAFAQAGTFDMARATDILTDAQSALGMVVADTNQNTLNMVKLSDILVKANTVANASVQQFGEALTNKAGTAMKLLNIEVEDGVAVLAAWADQGVKAMEAGEKFNIVTRDLQTAVRNNAAEFERLQISVFENGAFRNMADIIGDLERALEPLSVELQGTTLKMLGFQDRSVIAIKSLIGLSESIRGYKEDFKAAGDITEEVANKQMQSFSKQLGLMGSAIKDVMIELGGTMAPAIIELAEDVRDLAQSFADLEPKTQKMILKWALMASIIGPLLLVLGGFVRMIGMLASAMVLASGVGAMGALMTGFRTMLALLSGPVGLVIAYGILIKIIGDRYVAALERAIIKTGKFKAMLDGMDATGLQANLISVTAEVDRLFDARRRQADLVAELEAQNPDAGGYAAAQLAAERAELESLNAITESRIRLRDSYTERVRDAILATQDQTAAQEELNDVVAETQASGVVALSEDEAEALAALRDELEPTAAAMRDLKKARALLAKALKTKDISPAIFDKLTEALHRSELAMDAFADKIGTFKEMDFTIRQNLESSLAFVEGLEQMEEQVQALEDSLDPAGAQLREMGKAYDLLNEAVEKGVITDAQFIELTSAVDDAVSSIELMDSAFQRGGREWLQVLGDMQGLFHEDSAAAEALRSAMLALNIIMGIHAVLVQLAKGDVYSAIPRALAVAAMVAGMGINTGAAGSSASNRSLQERQGTGTVLGDAEEKSESLLRATEITADATSELVGINRGMLHALQAMQAGLSGASTILARGSNDADFTGALPSGDLPSLVKGVLLGGPLGLLIDNLLGGFIGNLLDKIFGGKSKVLDEGIRIIGGSLGDMMNEVFVQAFLQFKSKKHIFDDYDEYWQFQDLPEDVGRQFALVFGAIYDTVFEAAVALGMDPEAIAAQLDQFVLDDIDISLMDLSGDELQEELLAVFSSIFDDVAEHVMPWIVQFQQVGEGLGETLVRVATSVQVFREAIGALGLIVDESNPEAFAIMAVGLVDLTGGVEQFIAKFSTFFDKFASDEQKLEFATNQITRAFEQAGLELPETRDGMIDLMMSLDATTEAGRRQIAMLLDIADTADQYYTLVDRAEDARLKQADEFNAMIQGYGEAISEFLGINYQPLVQLKSAFKDAMKAADALNASQREYAMIARKFAADLRIMAAQLTLSVLSLADQLFGSGANDNLTQPIQDGFEETREVVNQVFADWQRALESISEYTKSLLLDEALTTLTPAEQLSEAQSQFYDILARAQAGDVDAAAALPDAAQAYLEEARFMFASGAQYTEIFNAVMAALDSISMPEGIDEFETVIIENPNWQNEADYTASALAKELERFLLAADLAQSLNNLAQVLGVSVIALAQELGIPLDQLVEILGFELSNLTVESASAIGGIADMLGADIFELLDALGIGLDDLAIAFGLNLDMMSQDLVIALGAFAAALGEDALLVADALGLSIDDLAKTFGIGIDAFSAEQFRALVEFSNALGVGVADVAAALDINLGEIADATSILSQALDREISALPPEIQSELSPYLNAIRDATTEADANLAIQALGTFILGLPPEIAAPLIPFLELMGFHNISAELAAIMAIERHTFNALSGLSGIARAVNSLDLSVDVHVTNTTTIINNEIEASAKDKDNNSTDPIDLPSSPEGGGPVFIPGIGWFTPNSFAMGGPVEETGMHMLHAGEFVVNRNRDNIAPPSNNDDFSKSELREIKNVLVDIRESNRRYQEEDVAATRDVGSAINDQAETIRRFANDR